VIETGELLYGALKNLISAAKTIQIEVFTQQMRGMSLKSWYKEFRTIKLGCARRTGHDYCISRFVQDNIESDFVLISATDNISEFLKKEVEQRIGVIPNNIKFFTCHSNNLAGIKSPDYVIINCSWALPQKFVDAIYNNFYDPKVTFIFIQ
jgi:hypothetical protein